MITQKEQELINLAHWFNNPWHILLFTILAVWTIIWKGTALWKAARNSQKVWFLVMLVVNTIGILEIIYIFFFSKKNNEQK